jgi:predicted porin
MNKKLVAVAIAGLLAAPLAQAQTANVTLYGRINLDMEIVNGNLAPTANHPAGYNPSLYRVSANSTRFGIRGTESLGGGLSAIFQIENGSINVPETGGALAGRDSFLGLSGTWGTFKMGRFLAPLDDIHGIFGNNPTATTSLLSTASVWANGWAGQPENGGFDDRLKNSVRYDTPTIKGFRGAFQFSSNENNAIGSSSNNWGLGGYYNNGPWQLGLAYEQHNKARGLAAQSSPTLSTLAFTDKDLSVAAAYQFPKFLLAGVYERMQYGAPSALPVGGITDFHHNFWAISGTLDVGTNGQIFMYYGQAGDGSGSNVLPGYRVSGGANGSVASGNDTGASDWELTYSYTLSKRTVLYTGYHKIDNDSRAQYNFNINAVNNLAIGGKPAGFVAGMYHSF